MNDWTPGTPYWYEDELKLRDAEIARLQTENEHLISRGHDCEEMLQDKEAEIARLRLNYKEMCDCAEGWEAEAERLRAALERVIRASDCPTALREDALRSLSDAEGK